MTSGIRDAIMKRDFASTELLEEIKKAYPIGCFVICSPTSGKPDITAEIEGHGDFYCEPTRVMARNVETMKRRWFDVTCIKHKI